MTEHPKFVAYNTGHPKLNFDIVPYALTNRKIYPVLAELVAGHIFCLFQCFLLVLTNQKNIFKNFAAGYFHVTSESQVMRHVDFSKISLKGAKLREAIMREIRLLVFRTKIKKTLENLKKYEILSTQEHISRKLVIQRNFLKQVGFLT